MEINRKLIDSEFNGYVLSADTAQITQFPLESGPLSPLQCNPTMRRAEWDAIVHHNCLTKNPFCKNTLYYINNHMELIRIKHNTIGAEHDIEQIKVFQFPSNFSRLENVSLSIAGNGLIVYCDGNGKLLVLKEASAHYQLIYECELLDNFRGPLLLLASSYCEMEQSVQCAAAQKLEMANGDGMTYRLWLIQLSNSKSNAPSIVSDVSVEVGLCHISTELALTSSLPSYCCFEGPDLLVHVENSYFLMVESADTEAESENVICADVSLRENDSGFDYEETMARPRYGIGFEFVSGESNVNASRELGHLTPDLPPLEMRFQKASEISTECVDVISDTKRSTAAIKYQLTNPTIESLLNDVEECDATEENTFGTLLLFNGTSKALSHHLRYECSNYRFLAQGHSGEPNRLAPLLFQNGLHGIVYEPNINIGRIQLKHLHTLPAFGYVQASKQDKKFLIYDDFAKFAMIGEYERRVFVYSADPTEKECKSHIRKQNIIEFGPHQLSGLQSIGNNGIVILTSERIVSATISR